MSQIKSLSTLKKSHNIYVTGHRGAASECPENTLLSFKTAIEVGADLIEMDIHKTKDNQIVVIHDGNTKRVGNIDLTIADCTFDQLKQVDLGKDQRIPLLDEVFKNFKGKCGFVIEIKAEGLCELLYNKIKEYDVEASCIIISFKHNELKTFRKLNQTIPLATLEPSTNNLGGMVLKKKMIDNVVTHNFEGIHPLFKLINKKVVEYAHANNIFVNPWTVDNEKDWKSMIEAGVDGITTNNPRGLINFLKDLK